MQANTQGRQAPRASHGVRCGRAANHQTRGGQRARAMGGLDCLVDLACSAEVVRRDDECFQGVSWRVRKKRKNSTPSRSRRFIICGLAIISATMAAILLGRK